MPASGSTARPDVSTPYSRLPSFFTLTSAASQQLQERRFIEHRYAELLSLGELRTCLAAGHYVSSLLRHTARHLATERLDAFFGLISRHARQCTGNHESLAHQR